jgi:hypothetical protein
LQSFARFSPARVDCSSFACGNAQFNAEGKERKFSESESRSPRDRRSFDVFWHWQGIVESEGIESMGVEKRLGRLGTCVASGMVAFACPVRAAPAPAVNLESFFRGKLRGTGSEKDAAHSVARTLSLSGVGTRISGGVRLSYDIVFSDGERQHRVWTFLKAGTNHYVGRRADLVGDAQISQNGNVINLSYTATVSSGSGSHNVKFDETFTQTGPHTIINRLKATYFFLTVATGQITVQKVSR